MRFVAPPPFGRMEVAGELFVSRLRGCPCIASSSLRHLASQAPNVTELMKGSTLGRAVGFKHPVAPAFSGMTECPPGLCDKGFERVLSDQVSDSN